MMGRTHGIHAEPTTFGLKVTIWYSEMERNLERFRKARAGLEVGKISGPVGTFSHLPPEVEEKVCAALGIGHAASSTQTLQRDRHAEYLCTLAILGSTYDKIATEVRHLQRTEVGEASEAFRTGQTGSLRHAPQEEPHQLRERERPFPGASRQRAGGAGEHPPSGTNGTSPTPRWSGSFFPTAPRWPTTSPCASDGWWTTWW